MDPGNALGSGPQPGNHDPERIPAATVSCPSGEVFKYCGPTSYMPKSLFPIFAFRPTADIKLGRIDGRITSKSALIGFSKVNSSSPPPNKGACLDDKKEKVTGTEFIFSVWDTGKVTIPPITINLFNSDSIFDFAIETDSIVIEVVSLVDLTNNQNMKPIKGPMPIKTILPIRKISLILLLSIILYGLYYIYGKRIKNIDGEIKSKINIDPADKIALMKLDILIRESDYTKINIKEFYVNLSYILREYVENSVYIKSLEMTTEEIIRNKDFFPFNNDDIDIWLDILNRADLSKYAKSNPNENVLMI